MGFYLGFGMQITNPKSKRLREIVKNLPIKALLIAGLISCNLSVKASTLYLPKVEFRAISCRLK
jgi:hypothetical protein